MPHHALLTGPRRFDGRVERQQVGLFSHAVEGEVNQLTEGLKDVEADADWKKKVIYD
jgi:hypothetical protein